MFYRFNLFIKNNFFLFFIAITTLISCSSSDNSNDSSNTPNVIPTTFSYTPVKTIFDNKCASCHTSGKSNAGNWLYDAANYETSIKASITKLYNATNSLASKMAVSQYGNLTQAEVDAIKTWYAAGYPATGSAPVIVTPTVFNYTAVKTIFDSKCATCHASGKSNTANWLYDASNYDTSIKASITKLYNATNSLTSKMAVSQYGNLTQAEVDAIKTWYSAGYPSN